MLCVLLNKVSLQINKSKASRLFYSTDFLANWFHMQIDICLAGSGWQGEKDVVHYCPLMGECS